MTVHVLYDNALHSDRPTEALYRYVRDLLDEGYSRDQIIRDLEALYKSLLSAGPEAHQEAVSDVLDALAGWSAPSAKL